MAQQFKKLELISTLMVNKDHLFLSLLCTILLLLCTLAFGEPGGPEMNFVNTYGRHLHNGHPHRRLLNENELVPSVENELVNPSELTFKLNDFCSADVSLEKVVCYGLRGKEDLPQRENDFDGIQQAVFVNVSGRSDIQLHDVHRVFPHLILLSINHCPGSAGNIINLARKMRSLSLTREVIDNSTNVNEGEEKSNDTLAYSSNDGSGTSYYENHLDIDTGTEDKAATEKDDVEKEFVWKSVRLLNLSWNQLQSESIPKSLLNMFPNLEQLDLSNNFISTLTNIPQKDWVQLKTVDLSGNPLDCTSDLDWLENPSIKLMHSNQTLCDLPPHQNKAKPIVKVIRLIKKVKEECRVNCTCDIAYIWEQNHVIHSKTAVNCSNRGFIDFPDPDKLPHPTDTLDLNNNQITSMKRFVEDRRYADLHVMNLYLDENKISSINILEGSDWFYNFQVFSIRKNNLTEVPVYVLENVLRQNKRILYIDLSQNDFQCECSTVTTFKVWLLRYSTNIKNVDEVRCSNSKEQIRYIKRDDWCKMDEGTRIVEILDLISITLAAAIVGVIVKVYYDYWNFKKNGKLPWIVRKM